MATKLENKVVVKSIVKLYLQSKSADAHFSFTTNDGIVNVPAHKAILAVASPVFDAMFYGPMKENDVVEIVDAGPNAFEEFLQLFYLPEVTISMTNIETVVRLADKYDMTECLNACVTILGPKLSKDNVIWGYQLAIALDNQPLKQLCESQIENCPYDVIKSEQFRHCDKSVLENILRLESLHCEESDLFTACFEWTKSSCETNGLNENDPKNLRNQLGDLYHLIRFETMTCDEIAVIMSDEQKIRMFSYNELADLFNMKSNKNFKSEAFERVKRSVRYVQWNSEEVLTCELKGSTPYNATQSTESTWFSVNAPVLLGAMNCHYIYKKTSLTKVIISSKMSIVEHVQQMFPVTNASKVLLATVVKFTNETSLSVVLPKPIEIKPGKMYEIRFEVPTNGNEFEHFKRSKSDVKLDEEVTIKFYTNPMDYESDLRGLVSILSFNRI